MARFLLPLIAAVACGSPAGPPHGPKYTPVNSPEAESPCPEEWKEAKAAREELLGASSREARERTAAAVFAQGDCEVRGFQKQPVRADTEDGMLRHFRQLRRRFRDAENVLEEVLNYEIPRWNVGALTRLGDLRASYAGKLRAARAPLDVRDPRKKSAYRQELRDLADSLDGEAIVSYAAALEARASVSGPDPVVDDWVRDACAALKRLDREQHRGQSLCR